MNTLFHTMNPLPMKMPCWFCGYMHFSVLCSLKETSLDYFVHIARYLLMMSDKHTHTYPKLALCKGQIISKQLLVSSDSSKKGTNQFGFFWLTVLKTNLFIRFLEKSENNKKSFWNYLTFSMWSSYILRRPQISTVHLSYAVTVKSKVEILQKFVAFSQ